MELQQPLFEIHLQSPCFYVGVHGSLYVGFVGLAVECEVVAVDWKVIVFERSVVLDNIYRRATLVSQVYVFHLTECLLHKTRT